MNTTELLARARYASGKKIEYKLGKGGMAGASWRAGETRS